MRTLRTAAGIIPFDKTITEYGAPEGVQNRERPAYVATAFFPNGYGFELMTIDEPEATYSWLSSMPRLNKEDFALSQFKLRVIVKDKYGDIQDYRDTNLSPYQDAPSDRFISNKHRSRYAGEFDDPRLAEQRDIMGVNLKSLNKLTVQQIDVVMKELAIRAPHEHAATSISLEANEKHKPLVWKQVPSGLLTPSLN